MQTDLTVLADLFTQTDQVLSQARKIQTESAPAQISSSIQTDQQEQQEMEMQTDDKDLKEKKIQTDTTHTIECYSQTTKVESKAQCEQSGPSVISGYESREVQAEWERQ